MKIEDKIGDLYEEWLLEEYPDEIKNKDDLINKFCNGYRYGEFINLIKNKL